MPIYILVAFISVSFVSAQRSGIKGKLYWMPPDKTFKTEEQNIPYQGLPLEIFVYELTTEAEVDFDDGVISKIYTPSVSRFWCKSNGTFKNRLPPGKYSVFVRYKNRFYGNLKDASGNLSPALINDPKQMAWVTITLTY